MHIVVIARLPVMAVGAVVGAWAAGTAYLVACWWLFQRRDDALSVDLELPE